MTALVLLALGAWFMAGVVFEVQTRDGTLIVEVNEPNPEVFVDGERVTVTWADGGKKAEVRAKPGTRNVEVKKDGFTSHERSEKMRVKGPRSSNK